MSNFEQEDVSQSIPLVCALPQQAFAQRKQAITVDILENAVETVELEDGYELRFSAEFPLKTLTEFIHFERDCCRFITFELHVSPTQLALRLRGSAEIKQFVYFHFSSNRGTAA